jgi:hypothetical protein
VTQIVLLTLRLAVIVYVEIVQASLSDAFRMTAIYFVANGRVYKTKPP